MTEQQTDATTLPLRLTRDQEMFLVKLVSDERNHLHACLEARLKRDHGPIPKEEFEATMARIATCEAVLSRLFNARQEVLTASYARSLEKAERLLRPRQELA